jgi:hypothetical protein
MEEYMSMKTYESRHLVSTQTLVVPTKASSSQTDALVSLLYQTQKRLEQAVAQEKMQHLAIQASQVLLRDAQKLFVEMQNELTATKVQLKSMGETVEALKASVEENERQLQYLKVAHKCNDLRAPKSNEVPRTETS